MRKLIVSFICVISALAFSYGQTPQGINYQAVVRDAQGFVISNSTVGMKIGIRQSFATGTIVYEETFNSTTSDYGLVNLVIGQGNATVGTFSGIDWSAGPYFVEVSADATGGTNYAVMGTQQLMSVPYALYAENSGTPGPQGATGPQGSAGADGNGIASTTDNGDGTFTFTYDDGSTFTTSDLTGPQGATGAQGPIG